MLQNKILQVKIFTENYVKQKNSREVQKVGYTQGVPHKNFGTVTKLLITAHNFRLCEAKLWFTSQIFRHCETKLLFTSQIFRHCETKLSFTSQNFRHRQNLIHLSKFSALWYKILIHLTKFLTLWNRIVISSTKLSKFSVLWKTLNFKMVSFCKVDCKCSSSFVQCIYNGV